MGELDLYVGEYSKIIDAESYLEAMNNQHLYLEAINVATIVILVIELKNVIK